MKINGVFPVKILASAISVSLMLTAMGNTAFAQQTIEEISVTGTRIRQTSGFTTPVPITAVTTQELTNFNPGNTISEQVSALPMLKAFSPQRGDLGNAVVGNGGAGTLNLRSLGGNRTLVLLDGARVVPANTTGGVNIDMFPSALVRSVDVVTGGASAAYGADAVGGVVNFVLDREFEGFKLDTSIGVHEYELTGKQWSISSTAGKSFFEDRLNLIGSLEAREIEEVHADRNRLDSFRRTAWVRNPAWSPGAPLGVPQRLTMDNVASSHTSSTGLIVAPTVPALNRMQFTRDGKGIVPFDLSDAKIVSLPNQVGGTQSFSGGREAEVFNRTTQGGPSGQGVVNRSGFFGAQWKFTDSFSVFGQGMVGRAESNDRTDFALYIAENQWAPSIAVDNAYLPENVKNLMIANKLTQIQVNKTRDSRFVEDGEREIGADTVARNVFTQWQYSAGFDWDVYKDWNLRASWQHGEYKQNSQTLNLAMTDRQFLGMDAVRDPKTGAIVCRVKLFNPTPAQLSEKAKQLKMVSKRPINPYLAAVGSNLQPVPSIVDPVSVQECVPYNVMGSGQISKEAQEYIGTTKTRLGLFKQDFAEMLLTGNLFELPAGPIGGAFGLTWRDQWFLNDSLSAEIDVLGPPQNAPELGIRGIPTGFTGGSANLHMFSSVAYIAGEMNVWEWFAELNVPVWETDTGQRLAANFAYRQSEYDTSGVAESAKIGLDISVVDDLRIRATSSTDVREPNFGERFNRGGSGPLIIDPVNFNQQFLITGFTGGDPNVKPETGETVTYGFVYQPSFTPLLEGFQLSVDKWDININGAITSLGFQRIIDECEILKNKTFCPLIDRDANKFITVVRNTVLNAGASNTKGIDYEVAYRTDVDFFSNRAETLNLRLMATKVSLRTTTPYAGVPTSSLGTIGEAELTAFATANYNVGPYSMQLQARHMSDGIININWKEGIDVDRNRVPSFSTWNTRLGYNGETGNGANWGVSLNITNMFNKEPIVIPTAGTSRDGVLNNNYDEFGRRYSLSFNFSF